MSAGQSLAEVGPGCGLSVAGGRPGTTFHPSQSTSEPGSPTGWTRGVSLWTLPLMVAYPLAESRYCNRILPIQCSGQPLGADGHLFAVPAVGGFQHVSWCARYLGRLPRASRCHSSLQRLFKGQSLIELRERLCHPVAGGAAVLQVGSGVSWKPGISLCAGPAPSTSLLGSKSMA